MVGGIVLDGITIIDACMGIGKTSAMINMINRSKEENKFLYITPLLSEVERIKIACDKKNFKEPEKMYSDEDKFATKVEGLMRLLENT